MNGKVSFSTIEGETFILQYTVDGLVLLEDRLDKTVQEIAVGMTSEGGMRLGVLRAVLWAGLQEHHQISERQAGELIPQVSGGAQTITLKVADALRSAFPQSEAASGDQGPRKAAQGEV
ncbi:MAG: hypothetical protein KA105_02810 [Caulobacter sp.]|nr:hypothetical protein [Caulobacter sp.]